VGISDSQFGQDVRQYLGILHKRRAIVVTCLAVSLLVAVLYNYTTRPLYQATTQLLIDRSTPRVLPTKDMVDQGVQDFQTEYELIRGRRVSERVVEKLDLRRTAELSTGPLMSPWERFQRRFLGRAPALLVGSDGIPLSPAAAALQSRISVEPLPGGRLINLRVSAYDPSMAARMANALADTYIEQSVEFRFNSSSQATDWLSERLADQKQKVQDAEKALLAYQEKNGLTDMAKGGPAADKIEGLEAAAVTARTDRLAKEAVVAQARAMSPTQLASMPALMNAPGVQEARSRVGQLQQEQSRLAESLGERHPDMVRARADLEAAQERLQGELRNAIRGLETEAEASRSKENSLQADLARAHLQGLDVSRKSVEYEALKREVDTNNQTFQALLSRAKETGLESELRSTNVRIVERADPPRAPSSPNRSRNYRLALLIGIAAGMALAFLFEHADATVKTPDDIKQMGMPFLGMVPSVVASRTLPQPVALKNPEGAIADAYRVLRTNLLYTWPGNEGRVVVVSSANPGEGKTTTTANLASALALNGAKVLIIDGDLRRPTIHKHLNIPKSPGLSDLIVGRAQASGVIQTSRYRGLHIIPCGYVAPNPAELLGSGAMTEIVAALKKLYDWVLIDSPPILAMADTPILCRVADGLIIVVAAEATSRPALQRAVDQVASVGGKVIGAVLNKVDLQRNSYYYSHYYGEYYRSYYSEVAGRAAAGPRPVRRP
jgi:polysaccharide biosynthesis transport protein